MARDGVIRARLWWVLPLMLLLSCDGGTRGSGIDSGFSTISGSLAPESLQPAAAGAARGHAAATAAVVVQIRDNPDLQAVVDPVTRTFILNDVPPGDATIDFVSTTTASLTLRGVPDGCELRMVNVRFEGSAAKPAGFVVNPESGDIAEVVSSRRKGAAPLRVTFNVSDVTIGGTPQVVWDFGDGARSGRASTSHDYTTPGNYVVQATITGESKTQRALTVVQVLDSGALNLQVTAEAEPDRGLPPLNVLFSAESSNAAGEVVYEWDFGDGTDLGTGSQVRHLFTEEGLFLVQVTARDDGGSEETDVVQVEVTTGTRPVPLSVTAQADRPSGPAPHRVELRAIITGSGPVVVVWDFDDGTAASTDPNPVHIYARPGVYFPSVTVSEQTAGGKTVRADVRVEVN